jgi:hypothetical protein
LVREKFIFLNIWINGFMKVVQKQLLVLWNMDFREDSVYLAEFLLFHFLQCSGWHF